MLYKKLSFEQLGYTEKDRLELIEYFDNQVVPAGYSKPFYMKELTDAPAYLHKVFSLCPFLIGKMMLFKTTKDADSLAKLPPELKKNIDYYRIYDTPDAPMQLIRV